jgi:prophage DNA circulation protein
VSFAAITLCVASQRVLIFLHVKCDFLRLIWRNSAFVLSFASNSGKTASEMQEMLKTAFGDNAMGRTQTSGWFCWFKYGETSVKDC